MVDRRRLERHIPALDGLRALAIIAVIFCHVNWATGGPFAEGYLNGAVAKVYGWGWVGVDLFFVLSGFLITGILYDAKGGDGFFRNFYARRALRIMPLYYGFLLFVVATQLLGWKGIWLSREGLLSLATYTYNFRVGLTGEQIGGMHHFWSLAVEEHFYFLWPLVVMALGRRALMRACLALAAAALVLRVAIVASGVWPLTAFFITPCRIDGLLAGSWVALAWRDQATWERLRRWTGPLLWGAICVLLAIVAFGKGQFIPDATASGMLVITVGMAALAVLFSTFIILTLNAEEKSGLRRALENGGMRAIGKYSYAIYVFHALILLVTIRLFPAVLSLPLFWCKAVVVVWVSVASFAAAWLSFHLYEKHFLRLKRHFEYRGARRAEVTIPVPEPVSNA